MMTREDAPDADVHDGDLIRWLDGDLTAGERARVDRALAADPALAARLEQLRTRAGRLTELLRATDPAPAAPAPVVPGPESAGSVIDLNAAWAARQGVAPHVVRQYRPMPGTLRAAIVAGMLLAGALLVPPVRAWLSGVLRPAVVDGNPGTPTVRAPAPAAPIDSLGITFVTEAASFVIEFAAAPAAGVLTIEWTDGDRVSAERYTAGGGEELQRIRPDLLRVVNGATSSANYRIVVPRSVTTVSVRMPGRADVVRRVSEGGSDRLRIELGSPSR